MDKIFICTNDSQLLGAKVAKSSILRYSSFAENQVEILEEKSFKEFHEIYNQLFLKLPQIPLVKKHIELNKNDTPSI